MLLATTNSDLLLPASRSSFSRLLVLRFPRKYHGYFQFERNSLERLSRKALLFKKNRSKVGQSRIGGVVR